MDPYHSLRYSSAVQQMLPALLLSSISVGLLKVQSREAKVTYTCTLEFWLLQKKIYSEVWCTLKNGWALSKGAQKKFDVIFVTSMHVLSIFQAIIIFL